ncbi:AcrR family transcriptional regulator [Actinoplanes tereljensis]|uniref:TetR family transcriptional regulator n=1 Tax=Paractinoplanes tereljensis TaxID=571912 RepID=A0A919NVP9_9ACTN|nr:TetR family transcriptional regulator [Actinoplanes tereljensis]GIF26154.1 TetR family transcriptional regulator [Actinoplanes tereljensis]
MAEPEGSGPITGLRDLKRERNRVLTAETAWRLFIQRGYDNVTVADICAAAEIAPRTFHRYFASKEDVIGEPLRYMTSLVSEHIAGAPAGMPDPAVLRSAMHKLGVFVVEHRDWLGALRTVIQNSAHLREGHQGVPPEREQEIIALLAARHGTSGEPSWQQRLQVAYAVTAFRIWHDEFLRGKVLDPLAQLDEMVATIELTSS